MIDRHEVEGIYECETRTHHYGLRPLEISKMQWIKPMRSIGVLIEPVIYK